MPSTRKYGFASCHPKRGRRPGNRSSLERSAQASCATLKGLRPSVEDMVQAALVSAFLLLSIVGLVTVGPGRMEAAPIPGLRSPRRIVIWAAWIGGLNVALNASALAWFFFVFPSIVSALLFWLMPYSLVLGFIDVVLYVRERHAVSRSAAPPRQWAIVLVLSLSIVMFGIVVLGIVLFHDAQLGNFDPGGL